MIKMRILVVEDEIHLAEALATLLKKQNYTADAVYNGEDGLDYAMSNIYDVIVLDLMLPRMSGLDVIKNMRREGNDTPVIMLTAKGEISDKIRGLDSGADDYLAKPFNTDELLARIRALGRRRGEVVQPNAMTFGDIELDTRTLTLSCGGRSIKLTLKESELLEYFMANKNTVLSKEMIIEKLWGFDSAAEANHVEVYVSFLRKKLKFVGSRTVINTVRGVGYSLK